MSSSRRRRRPHVRLESRRVGSGSSSSSKFAEQIQQETKGELRALPDLTTNNSSDDEQFDH